MNGDAALHFWKEKLDELQRQRVATEERERERNEASSRLVKANVIIDRRREHDEAVADRRRADDRRIDEARGKHDELVQDQRREQDEKKLDARRRHDEKLQTGRIARAERAELYRGHVLEVRFQVLLNWDRTKHYLVFNAAFSRQERAYSGSAADRARRTRSLASSERWLRTTPG